MITTMPNAAPHACAQPGCRTLVPRGKARCPVHTKQLRRESDARRGSAAARGYGAKWRAFRLSYLQRNSLCRICLDAGVLVPASVVDHIVAHKGNEALFWSESNLRPLCKECHDDRVDEGDFGRPVQP